MRAAALAAAAALLSACVSLEEAQLGKGSVQPGQRALPLVFAPPSLFFSELDSKAEGAAKFVPGLGLVVADAQRERDVRASRDLQQYLPAWDAAERFRPELLRELKLSGWPGPLIEPADGEMTPADLRALNQAKDMADWRERYYLAGPESGIARNYGRFLALDTAVVIEANLAPGVVSDGEGEITPTLSLVVRLFRAGTMRQLWRHEETVDEPAAKRRLYDYKVNPAWLLGAWETMMPALAQKMGAALRENLQKAGAFVMPVETVLPENPEPEAPVSESVIR